MAATLDRSAWFLFGLAFVWGLTGSTGGMAANYTTAVTQASLSANYDWTAFKGAHAESLADTTFLEANNYLGAVNPDGSNLWFQGWTVEGSL